MEGSPKGGRFERREESRPILREGIYAKGGLRIGELKNLNGTRKCHQGFNSFFPLKGERKEGTLSVGLLRMKYEVRPRRGCGEKFQISFGREVSEWVPTREHSSTILGGMISYRRESARKRRR